METLTYISGLTGASITFGDDSLPQVTYRGLVGAGAAPVDNFAVDTAYKAGAAFVRTKKKPTVVKAELVVTGDPQDGAGGRVSLWQTIDTILGVLEPNILQAGTLIKTGPDGVARVLKNAQYVGGFEVEDQAANLARVEIELLFEAFDPTWYSQTTHTFSLGSSSDPFGWAVPMAVPLTINGQATASLIVANAGNIASLPSFTFYGPLENYSLANGATAQSFAITQALNSGDRLIVDCNAQTVTYYPAGAGGVPLYSAFGGNQQWVQLAPGNNPLTFRRDAAGNNQCQVSYQDTWNHG